MDHRTHHPRPQSPETPSGARRDANPTAAPADWRPAPDREVALRVEHEGPRVLVEPGTGLRWQVREVDARYVPAARGDRCLIFDAETVVRRLWVYPAEWRQMPGDELLRLAAR